MSDPRSRARHLTSCALGLAAALALTGAGAGEAAGPAAIAHAVDASHLFGLQYIPKFDERAHHGAWSGTRTRGLAMRKDLGTQVGREGLIWRQFQPDGPRPGPTMADFDNSIATAYAGGMAIQAMVTECPLWASSAPHPDPKQPDSYKTAPPKGLSLPAFADGTDTPAPGKKPNPANPWAQALGAMADRYHGHIRYWQIWNEPDYPDGVLGADPTSTRRSWTGTAAQYARMLRVSRVVLAAHDPTGRIATGGLGHAEYLEALLAQGAGSDFDYVDFHAYGWPGSDAAVDSFRRVHGEMAAVLARHALHKGMLCSETGYMAAEPTQQADFVAKVYPTSLALGVESTMYYADVNPSWRNMGLVDWRTLSQKTAGYWAYKHAAAALVGARRVEPLGQGVAGYRIDRQGARPLYIAWLPKGTAPHPVELAVAPGSYSLYDSMGRALGRLAGPRLKLPLDTSPRWLEGDAGRAYVTPTANPTLAHAGLSFARGEADSSAEGADGPEAAFDADADTHWSNGGFKADAAWLQLTLARPTALTRLRIKTGPSPALTWFDVEASSDGKHYQRLASHVALTSWHLEDVPARSAPGTRFVRLAWHNPTRTNAHFNVFEVEAY